MSTYSSHYIFKILLHYMCRPEYYSDCLYYNYWYATDGGTINLFGYKLR